jgi:uncharacterized protein YdhG (YjbR/CyaY superfamily)
MAPTKTATKSTQKSAKRTSANSKTPKGFTDEEKAAMRERARELKAEAAKADGETELLAAIAKMQEPDRAMAKKLHSLIKPQHRRSRRKPGTGCPRTPRTATSSAFFQNAGKFKVRYQTLGFSDKAKLDDGAMWPTSYALMKLTAAEEAKITALVKKAVR